MTPKDIALFAATIAEEAQQALSESPSCCTTSVLSAIFDNPMPPKLAFAIGSGQYDGLHWEEEYGDLTLVIPDLCRWTVPDHLCGEPAEYIYEDLT